MSYYHEYFSIEDPDTFKKVFCDAQYIGVKRNTGPSAKEGEWFTPIYIPKEYDGVGYILLYAFTYDGPRFVIDKRWHLPGNFVGSWETRFVFRRSREVLIDENSAAKKLYHLIGMYEKFAKDNLHLLQSYIYQHPKRKTLKLYSLDITSLFQEEGLDDFEEDARLALVSERAFRERSKNPLDKLAISHFKDHLDRGKLGITIKSLREQRNAKINFK